MCSSCYKKFTSEKVFQKDEAIIDINGRSDITLCLYARDTLISTPSFSSIRHVVAKIINKTQSNRWSVISISFINKILSEEF